MKNTTPAKKAAAAKHTAPVKKTAAAPKPAAAKKTAAKAATKPVAKTTAEKASAAKVKEPAAAQALRVREDETPWTAQELAEVRASIEADVAHLREEIQVAEADLVGLMRDGGDGAGDDQADAGAMTFEREHEISVANNAREMLIQNLHALERLDDGTYGICESCGNPIGKLRLQAAPRATLCMPCKTKQERR
jgi:RNA polymerase-binding protein DksA